MGQAQDEWKTPSAYYELPSVRGELVEPLIDTARRNYTAGIKRAQPCAAAWPLEGTLGVATVLAGWSVPN